MVAGNLCWLNLLGNVVCSWSCRRERVSQYGNVVFLVTLGLGVKLVSFVMMSDFAKAKLST